MYRTALALVCVVAATSYAVAHDTAATSGPAVTQPAIQLAAFGDGPNPIGPPRIDCVTGLYSTNHAVAENSSGRYTATDLTGSHRFDASNVVFDGLQDNGDFAPWPIKISAAPSGAQAGCWYGGQINGAWDENGTGVHNPDDGKEVTWENPFHHAGVMTIEMDNFLIEDVCAYNHGDGLRPQGDNNWIDAAYLKDIHDDCVENDGLYNLTVTDSFFDGCYVAFSARTFSDDGADGSANLFEIRDTLVRLEPQPTIYKPEVYGPAPGHGPFFKWDSNPDIALKLALHNNIFLATEGNHLSGGIGVEEVSKLESCSNNVMVWTGPGEFPNAENLPDCFRITSNIAEWDAAVAAWYARHPNRCVW